jgi:hypothetical protein
MKWASDLVGIAIGVMVPCAVFATASAQWYSGTTVRYVYAGSVGNRASLAVTAGVIGGTCRRTGGITELQLDPNSP